MAGTAPQADKSPRSDTPREDPHGEAEERRRLGASDDAVEDALVQEFENTVTEGANRLNRTWRALAVTGLFGGIDVTAIEAPNRVCEDVDTWDQVASWNDYFIEGDPDD